MFGNLDYFSSDKIRYKLRSKTFFPVSESRGNLDGFDLK